MATPTTRRWLNRKGLRRSPNELNGQRKEHRNSDYDEELLSITTAAAASVMLSGVITGENARGPKCAD